MADGTGQVPDLGGEAAAVAERRPRGLARRVLYVLARPWVVLGISLTVTAVAWHAARMEIIEGGAQRLEIEADRIAALITTRMATYQQVLIGGAALFTTSDDVTRGDWGNYVAQLRVDERFPGIQATGYALRVRGAERAAHIAAMRRESGFASYDIRPPGERPEHVVIRYNEPYVGRNRNVIGFDMFAEPTRREAMERARDSGLPAVSGKVVLAGETPQDRPPGFVVYVPIFAKGQPADSIDARRHSLQGFIFGPFRTQDLMRGMLGPREQTVLVKVHDGANTDVESLLYDGHDRIAPLIAGGDPIAVSRRQIEIAGRAWTLTFSATPAFEEKLHRHVPMVVLAIGLAISLLLFMVARWLIEMGRSEQRFRDYAELGSDWFWEQDADLRFTYLSQRGLQIVGVDPKEVLGHTRHDVFGRPHRSLLSADAWGDHLKVLADRQPFRDFEVPTIFPNGDIRYLQSSGVPVYDGAGRFKGYRGIGRDVTEERRHARALLAAMEEAEAASRSKSAFLAHMSHELRTPLNAVLGFSEIIRDQHFGKTGQAKYIEYAGDIYKSGRHLLALVNDVLDMSRIEAGRYELTEEPVELSAIFDAAMSMLMPRAIDGRVLVRTRFDTALPKILADSRALKQVVINLISNAIKFTDPGGSVTVSAALDQDGGMDVTIADTGVGIPAEHLEAVFEPFHQVEKVQTRRQMGSGLGLAISRSLIHLHGGTVKLDSALGRGTIATVHLPAARVLPA